MSANRIAVIGAGSWGTTLAVMIAGKGCQVRLWARRSEHAEAMLIAGRNDAYLPGIAFPGSLAPVHDASVALTDADVVILAVPSSSMRGICRHIAPHICHRSLIISATKGLEIESGLRMSQIILQELGAAFAKQMVALSGPNLSAEVIRHLPAASVAAGPKAAASLAQQVLGTETFRVYTNADLVGVELGGALKNVIAVGAGMCDGLGYGDNTKAALLTRGIIEISRLGAAMGALNSTFYGLSGLGDLMATSISPSSRNRNFGEMVGRGEAIEAILAGTRSVVEGMPTTRAAYRLAAKKGIETPIINEIHAVLFAGKEPRQAVSTLMLRAFKPEIAD